MNAIERKVLDTFKRLLLKRFSLYKMILFGSRARSDAAPYSDMDVLIVLDKHFMSRTQTISAIAHGRRVLNMAL